MQQRLCPEAGNEAHCSLYCSAAQAKQQFDTRLDFREAFMLTKTFDAFSEVWRLSYVLKSSTSMWPTQICKFKILQSPSTNKCTYYTDIYFTLSGCCMFRLVAIFRQLTTKCFKDQSNKLDLTMLCVWILKFELYIVRQLIYWLSNVIKQ